MSNSEEEKLLGYSKIYHETVRKLRAENAEKERRKADWEVDKGLKPSLDMVMGSPLKSEEEISKIATERAKRATQEQEKMERLGVIEPSQDKARRNSLEALFGNDTAAIEKARAEQEAREKRNKEQKQTLNRDRGGRALGED